LAITRIIPSFLSLEHVQNTITPFGYAITSALSEGADLESLLGIEIHAPITRTTDVHSTATNVKKGVAIMALTF
jgi:hypothetical protein